MTLSASQNKQPSKGTDCCASAAARLLSSSLYLTAALDVYLTLLSLLARAADPPCDWKYLVADSFPPTFITRSCSHCHSGQKVSASVLRRVERSLIMRQGIHTIEIRRANKGDVDTEIAVVGGAIKAQIDTKRHRRPGRVLRIAVEAYLP